MLNPDAESKVTIQFGPIVVVPLFWPFTVRFTLYVFELEFTTFNLSTPERLDVFTVTKLVPVLFPA